MTGEKDVGLQVVETVRSFMQIDPDWSVDEQRGFNLVGWSFGAARLVRACKA